MSHSEPSDEEIEELLALDGEEFDRRFEELGKKYPPRRRLPPDLGELFRDIRRPLRLRKILGADLPLYMFERFETLDALIGGMGMVIEARDPELERKVAIKLWKQSGPEAQEALLAEAKVLAKLTHPNVVTVYETGRWGERVFFVMEWIDGVDGHKWMTQPRTWREIRDVFVGAGMGLAAAHDAGIQHRDFKPANMLIGNDARVVVADFGIADSLRTVDCGDPQWGTPVGTPTYMAPERLRGGRGDARSDQFSFCVAMWRGLYGLRPYAGTTDEELLASIEQRAIREVPGLGVPAWLSAVVRKGLAEDPDDRFQSMHELLEALRNDPPDNTEDDDAADEGSVYKPDGRVLHQPGRGTASRSWLPAMLATAIVVGGSVLGLVGYFRSVGPSPPQQPEPARTDPAPRPAPACALEASESEAMLDPVVLEACRLIRLDRFDVAELLWEEEYAALYAEQSASIGPSTLIVARSYVVRAEELLHKEPVKARTAAERALGWARQAAVTLGADHEHVSQVHQRAMRIIDRTDQSPPDD